MAVGQSGYHVPYMWLMNAHVNISSKFCANALLSLQIGKWKIETGCPLWAFVLLSTSAYGVLSTCMKHVGDVALKELCINVSNYRSHKLGQSSRLFLLCWKSEQLLLPATG